MAASDTKPINVRTATKAACQSALAEHFPAGTFDWAFFDALVTSALAQFEAGEIPILGIKLTGQAPARPRTRSDTALREATRLAQGSPATPVAPEGVLSA